MTTSATDPNVLQGDQHGFIIYPASWVKGEEDAWTPTREISDREFNERVGNKKPLQFQLPQKMGGAIFASGYQKPDPLRHVQAAMKLFGPDHMDFATAADDATRRYLRTRKQTMQPYTHLHGIGSWENNVEPSMMTVFHGPVDGMTLQKIGADVGSFARQHGILAFSPHPDGIEQLMHMRVPTHHPSQKLTPVAVAEISHYLSDLFNHYHDQAEDGSKSYLMPGRTILPDESGHSDVLVWVPPWEKNPGRLHEAFNQLAEHLRVRQAPQYWPGTGLLMGGTSPYSDEEAAAMSDDRKRDIAINNYKQVLQSKQTLLRTPQLTAPVRFGMHAPAQTGAVVRGVYYQPGKMLPNVEEPNPDDPPPVPQPAIMPPEASRHPKVTEWKRKVMDAYHRANKRAQQPQPGM